MVDRVDFYILKSTDPLARDTLTCRLAEKGLKQGLKVFVRTQSAQHTADIDSLMWSFSGPSFVPHAVTDNVGSNEASILIGDRQGPETHSDMLISLVESAPENASTFDRIVDLIPGNEVHKQLGRQRFRHYRAQGVEPTIHNL